jgi:hypothetical protein
MSHGIKEDQNTPGKKQTPEEIVAEHQHRSTQRKIPRGREDEAPDR